MTRPSFTRTWPAERRAVPDARHAVLAYLGELQTPDPPLSDIALAVSEAVSNAVLHAYAGTEGGGRVRVEVAVDADEVQVVVADEGGGMRPRPDSPGLGLGVPLIATVAERIDTVSEPGRGTRVCMWFRRGAEGLFEG